MTSVANVELTGLPFNKSIDDYNTDVLDAIAGAVQGSISPLRLLSDDDSEDINIICAQIDTWLESFLEITDYDHGLNFLNWEMASSLCRNAVFSGERTKEQIAKAVAEENELLREDDGSELKADPLDKVQNKIRDLNARLHFWRLFYQRAVRFYNRVAQDLVDQGMHWIDPVFVSNAAKEKQKKAEVRRMTAARYYAMNREERANEKRVREVQAIAWAAEQARRQDSVGYKLESVMRELENLREENAELRKENEANQTALAVGKIVRDEFPID